MRRRAPPGGSAVEAVGPLNRKHIESRNKGCEPSVEVGSVLALGLTTRVPPTRPAAKQHAVGALALDTPAAQIVVLTIKEWPRARTIPPLGGACAAMR